jgi:2-C-methyl-D-erythritol 2,4-cyclodiphosphate synthase/2-C-methyl-D-erythritol 4-phosphate cytidylyltransferase/2-C-methyl-D-erythritol 2,4-cyclodiphosphate synthase
MYRIGLGKDVHRLVLGRRLLLGGVRFPFDRGEDGHSDADVLIHAIIDAILGAACLGDIGEFFPPGDPEWKDADSRGLLKMAMDIAGSQQWKIVNIDCVVTCEKPKILSYRESIRNSLAEILGIDTENIFIKGKTAEGLGAIGSGDAIEAAAVCLLEKKQ